MNKGIILLSGGLDSLVSLGIAKENIDVKLALTFDYGQKACQKEIDAARKICEYYNVEHQVIKLDFLQKITQTALVSSNDIPTENFGKESAKAVWIPNRNGLFLNIAGSFCDSMDLDTIIIGANKEEGETFPDNTLEFTKRITACFEFSTLVKPKVYAPLINFNKNDIVKLAVEKNIPLELTRSCYVDTEKNCGKCESCQRLMSALKANKQEELIQKLF